MEDFVKKLFSFILLALLSANSYVHSISRNRVEHAIENSDAEFINNNLSEIKYLYHSSKTGLLSYAKGVKKLREKDLKLDKIKPLTDGRGAFLLLSGIAGGYGTFMLALALANKCIGEVDEFRDLSGISIFSFITSGAFYLLHKYDKSEKSIFRTRQQIYLDAIKTQDILESL